MRNPNQTFEFNVEEILGKVKTNREQHVKNYNEAISKYNQKLREKLSEMVSALDNGADIELHELHIPKPVTYAGHYDKYITILEMTTDTAISLDENTFERIVMDQWEWQHDFLSNTMGYVDKQAAIR